MEVTDNNTIRFYREDNIIFELNLKDNSVKRVTPSNTLLLIISNRLLVFALVLFTYIIYRLLGREMEMRKKAAEERIRESSKTEASESLYKRGREFTNKMLKRNSATAVFIAFLALCFIILLDILLLSKA